ncbi:hypothetical protein [Marinobacter pelagius]|uniref:hypothetical protein n=1 Tax=Marinobacter pelagius TaxID=379482 RepID=UPI000DEB49E7|nr:hypothetical protein [Marinobacter pelagius]
MPARLKITENIQFSIERMIRLWEGKLTWNALVQRIEIELGIRVTRQTLEDYVGIYTAYKQKKEMLRCGDNKPERVITGSGVELADKVRRLETELEIARKTINEQKRFLQRILQNAAEIPSLKGNIDLLISNRPEDQI